MRWPWTRANDESSPVERLHQWDGAYRWSGKVDRRSDTRPPVQFSAGSLQASDALLEDLANLSGARVSRRDALRASAVLRSRNLIAGVPATLPLELRDKDRNLDDRNWLGVQPHPLLERTVVMAMTFEDLLFESTSYWRVTRMSEGFPVEAEHLDHRAVSEHAIVGMPSQVVSEDLQFTPGDAVFVDGMPEPGIIRFVSPNPPLLVHAAKAIRTILLLDQIASDYATDPLPFGYFTDATDEEPLDDDEVNEVLDKWEGARRRRRWGYIGSGLDLNLLEWPPPDKLQLAQARNHAILEIARDTGLDPEDVGVQIQGASRTYRNAEQRRLDLIDFTLMPYISAVEDRFSMNDITPRTLRAHFVVPAFTRADFKTRMEGYGMAVKHGIMERNEIRRREGWPDLTKEQEAAADRRSTPTGPSNGVSSNGDSPREEADAQ